MLSGSFPYPSPLRIIALAGLSRNSVTTAEKDIVEGEARDFYVMFFFAGVP
jgi:hypothetical protein